jgi:FKBP-type peptidyl-prolyl cis-trans isomerase 2
MVKKGDFVKIDYTGRLDDGNVFDTTDEAEAKKSNIHNPKIKYSPVLMIVGSGRMIHGLESAVEGMAAGAEKEVTIKPEEGFGSRNPDMISIVPLSHFEREKINPAPGMAVNIDDREGIIKSVGGGRVIVDFNHPLAGQTLKYKVKVASILEKVTDKASALLDDVGIAGEAAIDGDTLIFTTNADPSMEYTSRKYMLLMAIKDYVQDIATVKFSEEYKITEKKSQAKALEKKD